MDQYKEDKHLFDKKTPNSEGINSKDSYPTGVLPSQSLRELINQKIVFSLEDQIDESQIQPASIDLRLGRHAYRVRASFLPGENYTVMNKIDALGMHKIDLEKGNVLEKGGVYIVPLQESVSLPSRLSGIANPKSSIGRVDVFTRLITDQGMEFDRVSEGYKGLLYAEISPRTFSVIVSKGTKLLQLRLRRGSPRPNDTATRRLHEKVALVDSKYTDKEFAKRIKNGVPISVDLSGEKTNGVIGYKAKKYTSLIDLDKVNTYNFEDYWEIIHQNENSNLILDPYAFYILVSKESVTVPPDYAAEMAAFNPLHGEFRVHYAGFFDPGFGHHSLGGKGSKAVLEVRSYELPFTLEDGQIVCRIIYERLTETPDKKYGSDKLNSNYQAQNLKLSKHFKKEI
ncbi:MAG: 2'-deoxycytidine 5'-triphosphate deaminase [Rhodospirillaceae bacterium]|nr:2'-deoxycytidine 5'-triphosphate deaminase [Rhodospirillaceae bacterium]